MKLINLKTDFLGRDFVFYKKIDSTQSEIWRLVKDGNIKNGSLIMSEIQTKGKGTHGKRWYTDESDNIAFSFYVNTECKIKQLDKITIEIANTIVEIIKEKYNIDLKVKEPNDITINDKKIGGILTESRINNEKIKFLVIGIGLNTSKMNFNNDIKDIATSIKKEYGIDINRLEFVSDFCNEFEKKIKRRINL